MALNICELKLLPVRRDGQTPTTTIVGSYSIAGGTTYTGSTGGGIIYTAGNGICINTNVICANFGTTSTTVACGSHTHTLNALSDVETTPTNGHILYYSGSSWCSAPTYELTLTFGQILYYNGTTISSCANNAHTHAASCITSGTLTAARLPIASTSCLGGIRIGSGLAIDGSGIVCATGGTGGATCLDALTDVVITTPSTGNILYYNGSTWCNLASSSLTVGTATSATNALALCGCVPANFAAASHTHGLVNNGGCVGTASGCILVTTTNGCITVASTATPSSHSHGSINNGGCLSTVAGCIVCTTTNGCLTTTNPAAMTVGYATNATNATSATTAANSLALCNCVPSCFLGAYSNGN